jgi:hypothetical protein
MRYASAIEPSARKRIADAPPGPAPGGVSTPRSGGFSEFAARMNPPSSVAKVAWPSLKMCHT